MKTNAIVSLADEKYFDLLIELIDSIKNNPESKDIAICILDAGLNDNQREKLKNKVDEVAKAECCLLYTSPSPRDRPLSRMPSSA